VENEAHNWKDKIGSREGKRRNRHWSENVHSICEQPPSQRENNWKEKNGTQEVTGGGRNGGGFDKHPATNLGKVLTPSATCLHPDHPHPQPQKKHRNRSPGYREEEQEKTEGAQDREDRAPGISFLTFAVSRRESGRTPSVNRWGLTHLAGSQQGSRRCKKCR